MSAGTPARPVEPVPTGGGLDALDGDELIRRFETGELALDRFHHHDHLRLTWEYHRRLPPAEVLARLGAGLRRLAAGVGKAEHYHETVTWAYALLVRERMARTGDDDAGGWDDFRAANLDLFDWSAPVLHRYYRPQTLAAPLARRVFVLPDRVR